jgi:alpha-beta hydrolase superfamily lysophospholipase
MIIQHLKIENIPAVLWGEETGKLFIAIHGDQSHKTDTVIQMFAGEAAGHGFQTLSFDLPEHGDRKAEKVLCNPLNVISDLEKILRYARSKYTDIGLFGCSIGAYFAILASQREATIRRALFLSPVVDMRCVIENLMEWFGVTPERLERERVIETPVKTLYWDYYRYVVDHLVKWDKPTALLYGEKDDFCSFEDIHRFAKASGADVTVMPGGVHYFHTDEQLDCFRNWLQEKLKTEDNHEKMV